MSLQSEILTGLDIPGWDDSIDAVKRVVVNALRELDRSVVIKDTRYFNHSFVPDFLLSWPREPDRKRDVYLRLDTSTAFLRRDVDLIGKDGPLLLSLTADWTTEPSPTPEQSGRGVATSRTLVTEPQAVERLGEASKGPDFGQVFPAAVLKGGLGWVDQPVAQDMATAASTFFAGAASHETGAVESALPGVLDHLDGRQGARVVNFGRIVWEATGGEASEYPVSTDLSGLDDEALRFLLEQGPTEKAHFWRSVGRLVELERLLGLGVRTGANLAALVRANADRLYARALLVKAAQVTLQDAGPEWVVESGALVLRGTDFAAYLVPRRGDLMVSPDKARALDFDTFRHRTVDEQVETVTIVSGDGKTVTIESEDIFDPLTDKVLATVGGMPGAAIASVGLIVAGKHLTCDFRSRVATGNTNASFEIISLLERALPMIWPMMDSRDVAEVRQVGEIVSSVGSHALFRSLEDDVPSS